MTNTAGFSGSSTSSETDSREEIMVYSEKEVLI